MKAYLDAIVQKWGSKRERLEPVWREADAFVVDQDDKPITVMRCTKAAGTNLYSDMHERPTDAFWTDTLAWQLCTTFTDAYVRALADAEPAIHYLKYGECAGAGRKTVSLASGDKVWHAILDERAAMFVTIAGKKGGSLRAARKKSKDAASARKAFDAAVKGKRAEGFR
jgi:hypothetical protein